MKLLFLKRSSSSMLFCERRVSFHRRDTCVWTILVFFHLQEGKLYNSDIGLIWHKYPEELHPWLLRLTEEFDLTFPSKDEPANIVPCLLPATEPEVCVIYYLWLHFGFAPAIVQCMDSEQHCIIKVFRSSEECAEREKQFYQLTM